MADTNVDPLMKKYEKFIEDHKPEFTPGKKVCWKEGLKNRRFPRDGHPAIVVKVLPDPIDNPEQNAGSPYFKEQLDIVLGFLDEDEDFLTYYYDSRRFELWPEQ